VAAGASGENQGVNKFCAWRSAKSAPHTVSALLSDKKATQHALGGPEKTVEV